MSYITPVRILMMAVNVVLCSVAQVCLKQGMRDASQLPSGFIHKVPVLIQTIFTNPLVVLGFLLYGISAFMWLVIIKSVPLSFAYPTVAVSYVIVTLLSWRLFGEAVTPISAAGLFVICCGVAMLGVGLARAGAR